MTRFGVHSPYHESSVAWMAYVTEVRSLGVAWAYSSRTPVENDQQNFGAGDQWVRATLTGVRYKSCMIGTPEAILLLPRSSGAQPEFVKTYHVI